MLKATAQPVLSGATWDRHAAILRDLAQTGPAQHRHVYESAAREAEAHAESARVAETAASAIMARLNRAAGVAEIADLMLDHAVQAALAEMPAKQRNAICDRAAERTRALGWNAGTHRFATFRRAA